MGDRIMAAAQDYAGACEGGTYVDAMAALDTLQRTIADEIAAAVAAERARIGQWASAREDEAEDAANSERLRSPYDGGGMTDAGRAAAFRQVQYHLLSLAERENPTPPAPTLLYRGKPVTDWRDVPEWTTPPAPTPEADTEAPTVCGYFIDLAGGGIGYNCERTEPCGEHGEFGCPLRHAAPVGEARELGNGIRSVTLTDDGRAIVRKTGAMGHTVIAATPADEAGVVNALDDIALDYNRADYGLPVHDAESHEAMLTAIRDYGDARARAASAVPAVVREAAKDALTQTRKFLREEGIREPARRRAQADADALDAWLRATAGAEGVK